MTDGGRGAASADFIQPFRIEGGEVRGRLVRLDATAREVLGRHDYPAPVARLLAEALALTAALAAALKYDGVFTFQTKGEGAVRLLVADLATGGKLRGYAQFDAGAASRAAESGAPPVPALLGRGYLALTVDQGPRTERYQGIVELEGGTLAECAHQYFRRSEQLDTHFVVGAGQDGAGWRSGALMVQRMPPESAADDAWRDGLDEWRRARALAATCGPAELLDPALSAHDLLRRLFHEDGVRVYRAQPLSFGCRCSRERAERVAASLPPDEIGTLEADGRLVLTCEFCGQRYEIGAVPPSLRA